LKKETNPKREKDFTFAFIFRDLESSIFKGIDPASMANSKSSSGIRNFVYPGPGKHAHALLPPKSPFPTISQAYADYVSNPTIGSKPINKPREGNSHHQRTSSESHLIEEQPSWLDDLLNEPDTPVRRGGHRRSSSDSLHISILLMHLTSVMPIMMSINIRISYLFRLGHLQNLTGTKMLVMYPCIQI
jgi:hypothetical protein